MMGGYEVPRVLTTITIGWVENGCPGTNTRNQIIYMLDCAITTKRQNVMFIVLFLRRSLVHAPKEWRHATITMTLLTIG